MRKYIIVAQSIYGLVYLMRNGRSWTADREKAFLYTNYQKALRRAVNRFGMLLAEIRPVPVEKNAA
jgi:hypothetical protein